MRAYLDTLWNSRDVQAPSSPGYAAQLVKRAATTEPTGYSETSTACSITAATVSPVSGQPITFLHNDTQIG